MADTAFSPDTPSFVEPCLSEKTQQELSKWREDRTLWHDHFPVIAELAECLTLTPLEDGQGFTTSTDGRHLFFCPVYSATLTDEDRRFLQLHLLWHCLAGHLTAPLVDNPHCWHLACDHEVNAMLLALDMELPPSAVLFPVCYGQSAAQVYRWLANHPMPYAETPSDIHPAGLWAYLDAVNIAPAIVSLWQHRAHLLAQNISAMPAMITRFFTSR